MKGKTELDSYKERPTARHAAMVAAVLNNGATTLSLGIKPPLEKEIRDRARKYKNAKEAIQKWTGSKTPSNARAAFAEISKCKIRGEDIAREFPGMIDSESVEEMRKMSQAEIPSPKKQEEVQQQQ